MKSEDGKMSFLEHLQELRTRLIRCALAVVGGTFVCWFFREDILSFLEAPLFEAWSQVDGLPPPQPLNFAGMLEPFIAYLKLSAIGGVFVASPVILYNLWRFVSPGLYARERKVALPFVLVSTLLFVGGSVAAYMVVFPIGFRFFLEFAAGTEVDIVSAEVGAVVAGLESREATSPGAEARNADGGPSPPPSPASDAGAGAVADAGAGQAPDAGTGVVADAGTGASPDAGTEARPDAGPAVSEPPLPTPPAPTRTDGSPARADAGPAAPKTSEEAPESGPSWYEWILLRLVRDGCRELVAGEAPGGSVALRFVWREKDCGPSPELVWVKRGDTRLPEPVWSEPVPAGEGRIARELLDEDPGPGPLSYEVGFSTSGGRTKLAPVLMVKDYLSFAIRLILAFGLIFELPVLISFLAIAGIVNYRQLLRFSRWFIIVAVVVGAILTPPDVVTQILLAVPLIFLYFVSVLVAYFFGPKPD